MQTFYSPAHLAHAPNTQFEGGRLLPAAEVPERAEAVRARIAERRIGPILAPAQFGEAPLIRVHDGALVAFLEGAHARWRARHGDGVPAALPSAWPGRGAKQRLGGDIEAQLGSFASGTDTPIMKGTWQATRAAADVALSAAQVICGGERAAFALTRPPGHHASADLFGGYCYLNNVAIAAQFLADQGMRPAILDVDYHHGNGTQSIFYARNDVFFCSIHADPVFAYPHFFGFADETGEGAGEDANLNLPLPDGTDWTAYTPVLAKALAHIDAFGPDVLLVSLGLDTYERDPIAGFKLTASDYLRMGAMIAKAKLPTLFAFEGGYNLSALGEITVNVLEGFEGA